jgi:hypothetical protein
MRAGLADEMISNPSSLPERDTLSLEASHDRGCPASIKLEIMPSLAPDPPQRMTPAIDCLTASQSRRHGAT